MQQVEPIRVGITGAAGQIGHYLCQFVAQGKMFGPHTPIHMVLIELPKQEKILNGIIMEIKDGAYEPVKKIEAVYNHAEGFKDLDALVCLGSVPRGPGMVRKDLLLANAKIFQEQGKALDKYAKKTVKVCVVGNPCCTNALIMSKNAPSIPSSQFTAMLRLDENRSRASLAYTTGAPSQSIEVNVWGNHADTMYPWLAQATINHGQRFSLTDEQVSFTENEVQTRGGAIIAECGKSSSASAANAACDHMKSWWFPNARAYSMGVIIDKGVKVEAAADSDCSDLCFGIACKTGPDGKWFQANFNGAQLDPVKVQANIDALRTEAAGAAEFMK